MLMGGLFRERSDASLCRECKKCEAVCPQHIVISQQLKSVANTLGGPKTEAILARLKRNPPKTAKSE